MISKHLGRVLLLMLCSATSVGHAYTSMVEANNPPTSYNTDPDVTDNAFEAPTLIPHPGSSTTTPAQKPTNPPPPQPGNVSPMGYVPQPDGSDDTSQDPDPETQPDLPKGNDAGTIPTESS